MGILRDKSFFNVGLLLACTLPLTAAARAESTPASEATAEPPSASVRMYGEAITLEEGGYSATSSAKALIPFSPLFSVYAGAQLETYQPPSGAIRRASPLAGIEADLGIIRLFAEYRYSAERPSSAYGPSDPRVGFTGGYWAEKELPRGWSLFSDTYAELASIPRISGRPTALAFSKLGLRRELLPALYLDPYLEAYGKSSADPALGRDALEARTGIRLAYWRSPWGSQLSLFRRFSSRVDAPEARWRLLLSLGGTF